MPSSWRGRRAGDSYETRLAAAGIGGPRGTRRAGHASGARRRRAAPLRHLARRAPGVLAHRLRRQHALAAAVDRALPRLRRPRGARRGRRLRPRRRRRRRRAAPHDPRAARRRLRGGRRGPDGAVRAACATWEAATPPSSSSWTSRSNCARRACSRASRRPNTDPDWLFQVEGFDPFREREVETWLTVANGETGTRGSLEEGSPASTPATFVAGVFGDDTGELHIRQPVTAPDWLCLRLLVEGMPLNLMNGEIIEHRRVLDMSQGIVFRYWRQRDRVGRTVRVRTARFASLADRSVMVLRAEASPEDFCGRLVWEACVGLSHAGGPVYEASLTSLGGTRVRGPHKGPQGRRPRAGGLDQAGGGLAGEPLPRAVARRDRRPARLRRAGDDRPPGGRGLVAQPPAGHDDRAGRPGAGGERRVRRAPAPPRRGLARALGRRRRVGRRRPARRACPALLDLPHDVHGPPHQGDRLGRRPRPVGHVVLQPRVLGHRDLRRAVLHLHAPRDGAHAARLPLPQPRRRPPEGARHGPQGGAVSLGVGRQGRRDHAALRHRRRTAR